MAEAGVDVLMRRIVERPASQVRALLEAGTFRGIFVSSRDGSPMPAGMLAGMALDDLDRFAKRGRGSGRSDIVNWQRLVEDIELLHELADPHDDAELST